ncbi:unnamed protein product [Moneuplotes crassus]|uniref:Uncharacterized protein n=1 Tax=Euplotes crassus TaxID=5936 RepID=A0AAD1XQ58_EUPCR|nr:unnamed protein product [Moneuplotes crassus]
MTRLFQKFLRKNHRSPGSETSPAQAEDKSQAQNRTRFCRRVLEKVRVVRSVSRETPKFPRKNKQVKISLSLLVTRKSCRKNISRIALSRTMNSTLRSRSREDEANKSFEKFIANDHRSALKAINESLKSYTNCSTPIRISRENQHELPLEMPSSFKSRRLMNLLETHRSMGKRREANVNQFLKPSPTKPPVFLNLPKISPKLLKDKTPEPRLPKVQLNTDLWE